MGSSVSRETDIKREVMSRYKRGELRRSSGDVVTSRAEAIKIALDMARRSAPAACDQLTLAIDLGQPSSDHQLLFVGNHGQHATESFFVCKLCKVTMSESGRGPRKRQFWGEDRSLTAPRCRAVVP